MKVIDTVKDGVWDTAGVQEQLDEGPGYRFMYFEEFRTSDEDSLYKMVEALADSEKDMVSELALIDGTIDKTFGASQSENQLDKALAIQKNYKYIDSFKEAYRMYSNCYPFSECTFEGSTEEGSRYLTGIIEGLGPNKTYVWTE